MNDRNHLLRSIFWPALFVSTLWLIELYFEIGYARWFEMGITPRTLEGLIGIFAAPFIHGGKDHLLSNTLPLLVVGTGLFYFYDQIAYRVIAMIWFLTGTWVWLSARDETHIGASGLIYGFVLFLFISGFIRKDNRLLAVSFLVAFLYGSLVWGILPVDQSISWESHLCGSIAGIVTAIAYKKHGPARPKMQWEIDEENGIVSEVMEDGIEDKPEPIKIHYNFIPKTDVQPNDQKNETDQEI